VAEASLCERPGQPGGETSPPGCCRRPVRVPGTRWPTPFEEPAVEPRADLLGQQSSARTSAACRGRRARRGAHARVPAQGRRRRAGPPDGTAIVLDRSIAQDGRWLADQDLGAAWWPRSRGDDV